MQVHSSQTLSVRASEDVVTVRQTIRKNALLLGFSIVDQTKVVTASSELARNLLDYGGGGQVRMEVVQNQSRTGLRVFFEDKGPGIADVEMALKDGFTTGSGLGLGLGGAKRLSHEFSIDSEVGRGTKIMMLRWKGP